MNARALAIALFEACDACLLRLAQRGTRGRMGLYLAVCDLREWWLAQLGGR